MANHFEKKIEKFRAEIRDNENELAHIRTFLVNAQRERDSLLQAKKLEAAESLLQLRQKVAQFSMAVEYLKILNAGEILKSNDDKMNEFIQSLIEPLGIDDKMNEISKFDRTASVLYLSKETLQTFEAYEKIVMHAVTMLKIAAAPIKEKNAFINSGALAKEIIAYMPSSKAGFDKFGEQYAYHISRGIYDDILTSLRHEISGADDASRDTKSIERAAIESRQAQLNIRDSLQKAGLAESSVIRPGA